MRYVCVRKKNPTRAQADFALDETPNRISSVCIILPRSMTD